MVTATIIISIISLIISGVAITVNIRRLREVNARSRQTRERIAQLQLMDHVPDDGADI